MIEAPARPVETVAAPSRSPIAAVVAVAGPPVALALLALLHTAWAGTVDPWRGLLSDYALFPGTRIQFGLGMLALAAGACAAAYRLALADPLRSAATRMLLVLAALGLIVASVFPTDLAQGVSSATGEIHRWSTAVVFTAIPAAGWTLGRIPLVRSLTLASLGLLVAFLVCHPSSPFGAVLDGAAYYGMLERVMVAVEIVLLLVITVNIKRYEIKLHAQ